MTSVIVSYMLGRAKNVIVDTSYYVNKQFNKLSASQRGTESAAIIRVWRVLQGANERSAIY